MPHAPEHKKLVDSLIDQELDTAALVAEVVESLPKGDAMKRIKILMRQVMKYRRMGKLSAEAAKNLLREGYAALILLEFTRLVPKIQNLVDGHIETQVEHIHALNRPLREVNAIRNIDIKNRDLERKGALSDAGTLATE